jgi:hypothetical protein
MQFEVKYDRIAAKIKLLEGKLKFNPQDQNLSKKLLLEQERLQRFMIDSTKRLETLFHPQVDSEEEEQWD